MKLAVVHISDIHLKDPSDLALSRLPLIQGCLNPFEVLADEAIILISGDLTYSGKTAEFAALTPALQKAALSLSHTLGNKHVPIIAVPGNHDCDFSADEAARNILLDQLIQLDDTERHDSVIDHCTSVQDSFFEFFDKEPFSKPTFFASRLYYEYIIPYEQKTIAVRCYNTSWMSRLHEKPGGLSFPLRFLDVSPTTTDPDFVISVLHHPFNWLHPDRASEFKRYIQETSDLILTGHEHTSAQYVRADLYGAEVGHIEAACFQEWGKSPNSSFHLLEVDLQLQQQRHWKFDWKEEGFRSDGSPTKWRPYQRSSALAAKEFSLSQEFADDLRDPGVAYKHPAKPDLVLKDIFVTPDFRETTITTDGKLPRKKTIEEKEFFEILRTQRGIIITGGEKSGKTSLLKTLYDVFTEVRRIGVVLSGEQIKKHEDEHIAKCINTAADEQFLKGSSDFNFVDRSERFVLIDDFQRSKLNLKGRRKVLATLSKLFGTVVVFGDETVQFEEIIDHHAQPEASEPFRILAIKEFGFRLRDKLIRKWYSIGQDYTGDPAEVERKSIEADRLITSLLGKDYLPAHPVFILTFLQAIDAGQPLNTSVGSYGYYYEFLVSQSLTSRGTNISHDIKSTFLGCLANSLFWAGDRSCSDNTLRSIHHKYCTEHKIEPSYSALVDELVQTNILTRRKDAISFRYDYLFYFFVAQHLCNNLSNPDSKAKVKQLAGDFSNEAYANVFLFLTHLSKDPFLLDCAIERAKESFSKNKVLAMDGDVEFTEQITCQLPQHAIPGTDHETRRENHLRAMDEISEVSRPLDDSLGDDQDDELAAIVAFLGQLQEAFRLIDVLGQLVRNFPGSLKGDDKFRIVSECYDLGLRTLNSMYQVFVEDPTSLIDGWTSDIYSRRKSKTLSKDEIRERVSTMVFSTVELLAYATCKRISRAVGTRGLEQTFSEVLASNPTNARRLVDLSVKLDTLQIPERLIEDLHKDFSGNLLCSRVLRDLVVQHFYMFAVDRETRQRVCAKLGIKVENIKTSNLVAKTSSKTSPQRSKKKRSKHRRKKK